MVKWYKFTFAVNVMLSIAINNRGLAYIQLLTTPQNFIQRVRVHLLVPIRRKSMTVLDSSLPRRSSKGFVTQERVTNSYERLRGRLCGFLIPPAKNS